MGRVADGVIIGSRLVRAAGEAGSPRGAADAVAELPRRDARRPRRVEFAAAMGMVVTLFLALAAMTVSYAFGQGGPVAGLVFFTVLLIGAAITRSRAQVLGLRALSRRAQARVAITSQVLGLEHQRAVAGRVRLFEEGA